MKLPRGSTSSGARWNSLTMCSSHASTCASRIPVCLRSRCLRYNQLRMHCCSALLPFLTSHVWHHLPNKLPVLKSWAQALLKDTHIRLQKSWLFLTVLYDFMGGGWGTGVGADGVGFVQKDRLIHLAVKCKCIDFKEKKTFGRPC